MLKKIEAVTYDFHGDLFIDIGGNVGLWTKELYSLYNRIIFIEPSSAIFEAKATIRDQSHKITYYKNICSDKMGEKKSIFSTTGLTGNFSIYGKELYESIFGIKLIEENIETITLDSLIPLANKGDKVLVKVDTEGADLDILIGGLEFIKQFQPVIVMEAHFHMYYNETKYRKIIDTVMELGYKLTELKSLGYSGRKLVDGKHTGNEMHNLHYQILMEPHSNSAN